ncbi:MAG: hypothetical protein V1921_02490 [Candidatus Altiarchaeota archaeon]
MKSRILLICLVVGLVLISGCTTKREVVNPYECPNGQLVDDISKCPEKSTTTVKTTTTTDPRIKELEGEVKNLEEQLKATTSVTTSTTPTSTTTTTTLPNILKIPRGENVEYGQLRLKFIEGGYNDGGVSLYKNRCSGMFRAIIIVSNLTNSTVKSMGIFYDCEKPIDQTDCLENGGWCNKADFGFLILELLEVKKEYGVDTAIIKIIA